MKKTDLKWIGWGVPGKIGTKMLKILKGPKTGGRTQGRVRDERDCPDILTSI